MTATAGLYWVRLLKHGFLNFMGIVGCSQPFYCSAVRNISSVKTQCACHFRLDIQHCYSAVQSFLQQLVDSIRSSVSIDMTFHFRLIVYHTPRSTSAAPGNETCIATDHRGLLDSWRSRCEYVCIIQADNGWRTTPLFGRFLLSQPIRDLFLPHRFLNQYAIC